MRSSMAPSAAHFLIYGALNLTPRICSKSLFSSTTMTMWSYTGSVGGHGGLLAATALLVAHDKRAIMHACEIFGICAPPLIIPQHSRSRCTHIRSARISARRWLCYHCIHVLLMLIDPRG